jgi:hypothetical protein
MSNQRLYGLSDDGPFIMFLSLEASLSLCVTSKSPQKFIAGLSVGPVNHFGQCCCAEFEFPFFSSGLVRSVSPVLLPPIIATGLLAVRPHSTLSSSCRSIRYRRVARDMSTIFNMSESGWASTFTESQTEMESCISVPSQIGRTL